MNCGNKIKPVTYAMQAILLKWSVYYLLDTSGKRYISFTLLWHALIIWQRNSDALGVAVSVQPFTSLKVAFC